MRGWAAVLLLGTSAWATPATRCESGELQTTARYYACRLKAAAKTARTRSGTPDLGQCDAKFSSKWRRAETKGEGECPSSTTQTTLRAFVTACADAIAVALAGGTLPACVDIEASAASARAARRRSNRCQSAKLRTAGTYASCRLNVNARAARKGNGTLDFVECAARERWRVYTTDNDAISGAGASVWSSAAVDDARKLVFIGTGQAYEEPAGDRTDSLIAIRDDTGEVAWVHQFTAGDVFTVAGGGIGPDADVGAAPNLFSIGSRDVVGVGQKNGFYHVLDRETGETVWEVQLAGGSPLGGVMVTAAVHDGVI